MSNVGLWVRTRPATVVAALATTWRGERKPHPVIARSLCDAAVQYFLAPGLPRGACHRARIRATRWLAMTLRGRRKTHPVIARSPCDEAIQFVLVAFWIASL